MKNKSTNIQEALGITKKEVAYLIDSDLGELDLHESGLEDLPLMKKYSFDFLHSLSKLATKCRDEYDEPEPQDIKQNKIMKLLEQNEKQQKVLISKIKWAEHNHEQQLTRVSLLNLLIKIKTHKQDTWTEMMSDIFAKLPKPNINKKELYSNQLKLKVLKYERRLLEQDLQSVFDNTEIVA